MQTRSTLVLIILLLINNKIRCEVNNVCKTVSDYNTIETNPNCWYNYIVNSTVPEIIVKSGRPFKEYKVHTDDGYILTIFRIPAVDTDTQKRRNPVFLQHGLITTSANWVSLGNESLAFQLHDQGYDVWLGNYRGTQYSEEHIFYTVQDFKYWDYSVDDIALKDLPAVFKRIANETGSVGDIIYIGHSLGTSFPLMYASENPDEAKAFLKIIVLTAPVYTLSGMAAPIRYLTPFSDIIYNTITNLGLTKLVSHEKTTKNIVKTVCMDTPQLMALCFNAFQMGYGPKTSVAPDKYPMFFEQHPSGSSIKLIRQVADFVRNFFTKFDYGAGNVKAYGSFFPPQYDISKIQTPTAVFYAKNDWLTGKDDSINLYRRLPASVRSGLYEIQDENFNHIDFMFGSNAKALYVDSVIRLLEKLPKADA